MAKRFSLREKLKSETSKRQRYNSSLSRKTVVCPVCRDYFRNEVEYREHYKKTHKAAKLVSIHSHLN